jgi:putative transposase
MTRISYKRHRFPPTVIEYAVWLCFRFTLSLRDVEEMLAQRRIDVSYEMTSRFQMALRAARAGARSFLTQLVSTLTGE